MPVPFPGSVALGARLPPFAAAAPGLSGQRSPGCSQPRGLASCQAAAAAAQRAVRQQLAACSERLVTAQQQARARLSDGEGRLECALRAVLALLATLCLQLAAVPTAGASMAEDRLLELVRQVEARVDGGLNAAREAAAGLVGTLAPPLQGGSSSGAQSGEGADPSTPVRLVEEVWEVVDSNFLDARNSGFDRTLFQQLMERVRQRPPRDTGAAYSAIRALLAELHDPYSRFITPREFSSMLKYDISGVGLNLGTAEELTAKTGLAVPEGGSSGAAGEGVWVVGLIRGSLADAAGLQQGDQLLELDGRGLRGRSPFEVASQLQGVAQDEEEEEEAAVPAQQQQGGSSSSGGGFGTLPQTLPLELKVRKYGGSVESMQLERPVVMMPSPVTSRVEKAADGSSVGYIRLASFNARAQRDTAAAVRGLLRGGQGAGRLVLDLRNNRGGLVSEGIEVAKLFLGGDALVVQTEGKARASSQPILAPGPPLTDAPLVVLVNDHTASASEILAGALRDNCRAVLAGKQTYGKGLIQSVYELSDGSGLVLTVGRYLTPSGIDIDREGLRPDFRKLPSAGDAQRAIAACRIRQQPPAAAQHPVQPGV